VVNVFIPIPPSVKIVLNEIFIVTKQMFTMSAHLNARV